MLIGRAKEQRRLGTNHRSAEQLLTSSANKAGHGWSVRGLSAVMASLTSHQSLEHR